MVYPFFGPASGGHTTVELIFHICIKQKGWEDRVARQLQSDTMARQVRPVWDVKWTRRTERHHTAGWAVAGDGGEKQGGLRVGDIEPSTWRKGVVRRLAGSTGDFLSGTPGW